MKAALEAWGADRNLFHKGAAKQSDGFRRYGATMAAPGLVLKRPVGSSDPFKEHAELPTNLAGEQRIFQAFRNAHPNATVILASHRLGIVRFADRIAILDRTQIDAFGIHQELIERGGKYAELYALDARGHVQFGALGSGVN